MTSEPETGTELQRRGETLPDVTVANRAGSIVSEFVSSIVDEAQARGVTIIEEAEEEARAQREAAGAGAGGIHQRVEAVTSELKGLLEELRSQSEALSGEPAVEAALPPRLTPAGEKGAATGDDAEVVDATLVEDVGDPTGSMVLADQNGTPGEADEAEDPRARVARMSDEELARAYTNAVKALQRPGTNGDGYEERLRNLAEAAVEEALERPVFTEGEPEPARGLRRRAGARKRRRRAVLLSELREACRQAREYQVAAGSPGP